MSQTFDVDPAEGGAWFYLVRAECAVEEMEMNWPVRIMMDSLIS